MALIDKHLSIIAILEIWQPHAPLATRSFPDFGGALLYLRLDNGNSDYRGDLQGEA